VVDHPLLGRIGPFPFQRAGSHRPLGFMLAAGPGVPGESEPQRGHALDIAPTILSLMGARIPQRLEGKALIEPVRASIAWR
jgi:predicted AlkP superfamily phosphohydrolase/phosphomutase